MVVASSEPDWSPGTEASLIGRRQKHPQGLVLCVSLRGALLTAMGIKNLTKLIQTVAAAAIKEVNLKELMGRTVAIDASMAIYSFLVAVRSASDAAPAANLTNEAGEVTSHIQGLFTRTIRLMEMGIRPVYVFDGKAPTMKSGELAKRREAKQKAQADLEAAELRLKAARDVDEEAAKAAMEEAEKLSKRTVRMDKKHQEDCKRLLRLMGVPVVESPCEAEAQCAALAKAGVVWAAASEDMDTLCFGTPRLIRRLTFSDTAAKKNPIWQIDLDRILSDSGLTMEEFVDVCILCGCDYLEPIKGVGPIKAYDSIRKHKTLDAAVAFLRSDKSKAVVPDSYPYDEAQRLFHEALVADAATIRPTLRWTNPDEDGLIEFLVTENGFDQKRVQNAIARLRKAKEKSAGQTRMESFFTAVPKAKAAAASSSSKTKGKPTTKASAASKPAAKSSVAAKPKVEEEVEEPGLDEVEVAEEVESSVEEADEDEDIPEKDPTPPAQMHPFFANSRPAKRVIESDSEDDDVSPSKRVKPTEE
jgi:flap endonuclease-1